METRPLPEPVRLLCQARDRLREHYKNSGLTFTLDGKVVGDIGEVIVAEEFDLILCTKRTKGVDAHAKDGRSVQIKATGKASSGPAYTPGKDIADHLIFVRIDFEDGLAEIRYNGPEAPIRAMLPPIWSGTRCVRLASVLAADKQVLDSTRLPRVGCKKVNYLGQEQ